MLPQSNYGYDWDHICWLNPTLGCAASTIPAGSTICVKNGATPPTYTPAAEPTSERAVGGAGTGSWNSRQRGLLAWVLPRAVLTVLC